MEQPEINQIFHTYDEITSLNRLKSSPEGITDMEAGARLELYGRNELKEGHQKTIPEMFLDQFKDIMIIILLIAAAISGFMGELTDTFIILVVVIINAVLGVFQENKAEKALAALKKMSAPFAKVKRDGLVRTIPTVELVPGDIVLLDAGDYVPADLRLIEVASLKVEEAALTGESAPVEKSAGRLGNPELVIGDRKNMAYSGSSVTYGRSIGVVTATGMRTEVGKIAVRISQSEVQETPLQRKLAELSKYLSIGIIVITIIIFITGVFQGRDGFEMFLIAVSLAVAAIPEGLPAVITIVLALGVQKMAKRNAIIRKLSAVETLGSTEIICSDKTGTLTQNKMTVKQIYSNNRIYNTEDLSGQEPGLPVLMQIMALCNDVRITRKSQKQTEIMGDPTETALVEFASRQRIYKDEMEILSPRRGEIPFDSDRKLMTTVNLINDHPRVLTKGAPEILLDHCGSILIDGQIIPLTTEWTENIRTANSAMAGKALRVLALAFKDLALIPDDLSAGGIENGLVFAGLVGMIDPPRPEVREAIRVCAEAGIRPVMITGDHRDTAAAIAKELNMIKDEAEIITGSELNTISDADFEKQITKYSVYARVSPEHKVRIVNAWKKQGKIVAMTGDGVNDAPALKVADIGVGMGITGTDVAKGVSNMVLADDNFATIIIAVEEGRKIYSNIRKVVQFLLSSNLGEITTIFIGTMLNWTVLLPIHILWVNLVTDTLPALALGVEKTESDVMRQKPRMAGTGFFADRLGWIIIYQGIIKGLITLSVFYAGFKFYGRETAITMTFMTLGLIQLAHSLNARSNDKSLFKMGIFSNIYLTSAIAVSAVLQIIVVVIPYFNSLFKVKPLNPEQWGIVLFATLSIIPIVELVKLFHRKNSK